jgi:hypothetical protein
LPLATHRHADVQASKSCDWSCACRRPVDIRDLPDMRPEMARVHDPHPNCTRRIAGIRVKGFGVHDRKRIFCCRYAAARVADPRMLADGERCEWCEQPRRDHRRMSVYVKPVSIWTRRSVMYSVLLSHPEININDDIHRTVRYAFVPSIAPSSSLLSVIRLATIHSQTEIQRKAGVKHAVT